MIVEVIKDATLTVKAGQLVEVSPEQAALAIRLGLAKEPAAEKAAQKKPTKKK